MITETLTTRIESFRTGPNETAAKHYRSLTSSNIRMYIIIK